MAKDPAFLFYPGDYISGTMYLDFECKGAYMDLLMLQFQKDHMTIHMIKQVLGHKFDHIWSLISDKFQEKEGKYWNERLRIEKENRVNFCKSRKKNRESTIHMNDHMSSHMEDEDVNRNERLGSKGKMDDKDRVVGKGEEGREGIFIPTGIGPQMVQVFKQAFPEYPIDQTLDFGACLEIANKIALSKNWTKESVTNGKQADVVNIWMRMVGFIRSDKWFSTRSLSDINKEFQRLSQSIQNNGTTHRAASGSGIPDPTVIGQTGFGRI